jgi:CubicO group peptidase (beta-lactamase class C family)
MKNSTGLLFTFLFFYLIQCNIPGQKENAAIGDTPESRGISSKAILDFVEAAEKQRPDDLHSIIIRRQGKKIAEGYWAPYNEESNHRLFSLSKSFTSTAIGIAQEEGLLSIYDPVISFFPESLPDSISPNLKAMRIKDLLRMSTGHDQDATGALRGAETKWVEAFLSLGVEHKPGTHFVYNSAATFMLSAIIQKVTGETLQEYLTPRLFEPLGITNPKWDLNPDGINVGGWGLNIRTKDIASFGQLYLQKGLWNGERLISEAWVEEATSLQTSNGSNPNVDWDQGYGYQFWQCRHGIYRGDGAFGQYCIVMPEQEVVVAITSGTNDMQAILNLVWDHLLPAFQEDALPPDEESYNSLLNKLAELRMSTIEGENTSDLAESISGKKYELAENALGIKSMVFELSGQDQSITFESMDEEITVPVGYGKTERGAMLFPQYGKQPVETTGAWVSNTMYKTRMYYYETPFNINIDFIFSEDVMTADIAMNVSFGSQGMPQLIGKAK